MGTERTVELRSSDLQIVRMIEEAFLLAARTPAYPEQNEGVCLLGFTFRAAFVESSTPKFVATWRASGFIGRRKLKVTGSTVVRKTTPNADSWRPFSTECQVINVIPDERRSRVHDMYWEGAYYRISVS